MPLPNAFELFGVDFVVDEVRCWVGDTHFVPRATLVLSPMCVSAGWSLTFHLHEMHRAHANVLFCWHSHQSTTSDVRLSLCSVTHWPRAENRASSASDPLSLPLSLCLHSLLRP